MLRIRKPILLFLLLALLIPSMAEARRRGILRWWQRPPADPIPAWTIFDSVKTRAARLYTFTIGGRRGFKMSQSRMSSDPLFAGVYPTANVNNERVDVVGLFQYELRGSDGTVLCLSFKDSPIEPGHSGSTFRNRGKAYFLDCETKDEVVGPHALEDENYDGEVFDVIANGRIWKQGDDYRMRAKVCGLYATEDENGNLQFQLLSQYMTGKGEWRPPSEE